MLVLLILSVLATLIPTIAYIKILRWFDRYEKTTRTLALTAFFWGIMPAIVLALVGYDLARVPFNIFHLTTNDLIESTVFAPLTEEPAKAVILFVIFWAIRRDYEGPIEGIIYGAMAGYGFALTENVMYFIIAWMNRGWGAWTATVVVRSFFFGMNHAFFTSITGMGLGLARVNAPFWARAIFPLVGLATAMTFHSVHNLGMELAGDTPTTFAISTICDWGGAIIVVVLLFIGGMYEKMRVLMELREEVETGLIDQTDFKLAYSYRARVIAYLIGWLPSKRRLRSQVLWLVPLMMDLAYLKYRMRTKGHDHSGAIYLLRNQIALARAHL
jgi:protease PrsW